MQESETNPDYIAPPGQMIRCRSRSKHNPRIMEDPNNGRGILERMYQDVFRQLIEKGLFDVIESQDLRGFTTLEISLDVRTPAEYGSPKWERINVKNDFLG